MARHDRRVWYGATPGAVSGFTHLSLSALILAIAIAVPLHAGAADVSLESAAVKAERWAFYARNGYRWEYAGFLVLRKGEIIHSFPRTLKKLDAVPMDAYTPPNAS